jgi:hypothetical protein
MNSILHDTLVDERAISFSSEEKNRALVCNAHAAHPHAIAIVRAGSLLETNALQND